MIRFRILTVLLATGALGCADSPTGPPTPSAQPGWLTVELETADTDAGGLVFVATGGPIDSVRVAPGYQVMARAVSPSSWQVLVIGRPLAPGALGAVHVPDVAQGARYAAQVLQAAADVDWAQRDPERYALRLHAP